jgi:hypothetical protein
MAIIEAKTAYFAGVNGTFLVSAFILFFFLTFSAIVSLTS